MTELDQALDHLPLIAILRGIEPDNAVAAGTILIDAGFRIIEVPLNSPEPLLSIERLVKAFGNRAIIVPGDTHGHNVIVADNAALLHDLGCEHQRRVKLRVAGMSVKALVDFNAVDFQAFRDRRVGGCAVITSTGTGYRKCDRLPALGVKATA